MSSPTRSPDWPNLPEELLAAIAKRLTSIHDYISFRGVCHSWRSAAKFDNFDRAFPRVPWLMYVSGEDGEKRILGRDDTRVANFLDLSKNKTYKIINFPPAAGIKYFSCSGWILYVSEGSDEVNLTHPVWPTKIELPGMSARSISKMVISDSPTIKTDLVVMVIWGAQNKLGFSRLGNDSFTVVAPSDDSFCDIIYHNRRLYAVDVSGRVIQCDIHGPDPAQIQHVFSLPNFDRDFDRHFDRDFYVANRDMCYLVESSGKFLIVSRHFHIFKTVSFQIFEFDLIHGSHQEINDLGNRALFLGFNSSFCLDPSAWNEVKPNCIYFTDHYGRGMHSDTGVYCLLDQSINGLPGGFSGDIFTPHTWVVPSF